MVRLVRWDAPFWAAVLIVAFSLGSLGCFGVAALQTTSSEGAGILTTDDCPPPADL